MHQQKMSNTINFVIPNRAAGPVRNRLFRNQR